MTGAIPPAVESADERFWRRHGYVGVAISLFASAGVFGYASAEPPAGAAPGTHPQALMALAGLSFALSCATAVAVPFMVRSRHRDALFLGWSSTLTLVILAGAAVDGGDESAVVALLFLPLLYAGMAYAWQAVLGLSILTCAGYFVIGIGDITPESRQSSLISVSLALAGLMSSLSAFNREVQHRSERELASRLEVEATRDPLTNALNRRAFDAALEWEIARANRYRRPLSVLFIDVDNLKQANDTFGHEYGDAVLVDVVRMLSRLARRADVVGRWGGDEFAVFLTETSVADAAELAERLTRGTRSIPARTPVTISVGVAGLSPAGTDDIESLFARADTALYAAKAAGRDCVRLAPTDGEVHADVPQQRLVDLEIEKLQIDD